MLKTIHLFLLLGLLGLLGSIELSQLWLNFLENQDRFLLQAIIYMQVFAMGRYSRLQVNMLIDVAIGLFLHLVYR